MYIIIQTHLDIYIYVCNTCIYIPWSRGLYALYKPGNKEVFENNFAQGHYFPGTMFI